MTRSGRFSRKWRYRAAFQLAVWQYCRLSSVPAGKGVTQCRQIGKLCDREGLPELLVLNERG